MGQFLRLSGGQYMQVIQVRWVVFSGLDAVDTARAVVTLVVGGEMTLTGQAALDLYGQVERLCASFGEG